MVLSKHGVLMIDSRVVEFYDIYWHIKFWQELMIIGGKMGIGLGWYTRCLIIFQFNSW